MFISLLIIVLCHWTSYWYNNR